MRPRILVVDDEPDIVELVSFNLKAEGYEVITADNGFKALDQARLLLPDLIVLDLMLPELDGLSVCEILHRVPATARIPVIMLTAWTSELSRLIGLDTGAEAYMTKPFSPRELISRVNKTLQSHGTNLNGAKDSPENN
ncbi:MAG: two component transcriptional regulator, winged helix family [Pedosphaera sp.]|nr:two component transcriptional regulator, winged helix family [Pedosphaera sp.]